MIESKPKILIVNSCGKAKLTYHPNQPSYNDLKTNSSREHSIERFRDLLTRAGSLYTGPQASCISKAVNILKENHAVDYYIISAGFGLVHEDVKLPPYDCTFTSKTPREIQEMTINLNIQRDFHELAKFDYDFVYLALGRTYLSALGNLIDYKNLGKFIVHFGYYLIEMPTNFRGFNAQILVNSNKLSQILDEPIGTAFVAKGSILLNYALELRKQKENVKTLPFDTWWESKIALIDYQNKRELGV
jgi:hypothetical protein